MKSTIKTFTRYLGSKTHDPLDVRELRRASMRYIHIMKRIAKISGGWNIVEIFTPSNLLQEKKKTLEAFKKGARYNPQFRYEAAEGLDPERQRKRLKSVRESLNGMPPSTKADSLVHDALHTKLVDDLATCDIISGLQRGDEALVKKALAIKYPPLEKALLRKEKHDFKRFINMRGAKDGKLSQDEIHWMENTVLSVRSWKNTFEEVLSRYGLLRSRTRPEGFKVVISDETQTLDVRHRSTNGPTIFLPNESGTVKDLILMIRHEIEAHVRQSANGERMFGIGGGAMTLDDETVYEEYAMRLENDMRTRYFGSETPLETVTFYAHAVSWAQRGYSFAEIMEHTYEMYLHMFLKTSARAKKLRLLAARHPAKRDYAMHKAWRTTYRVMRGHRDSSNHLGFAMCKDLAYGRGEMIDKCLQRKGVAHRVEMGIIGNGFLPLFSHFTIQNDKLAYPDLKLAEHYLKNFLSAMKHRKTALS